MENPSDKTLNQQVINNQRPSGSIVPQGQQNFIPITEMFDTPETLLADAISVNPDAVARIDYWKADIDKYGINAFTLTDTTGNERIAPRFAGMRQSQFMRYYEHPDFADLGFTPYANMEEYYNANSTMWDDMGRMWGQYTSLAGAGFTSVY